MDNQKLVLPTCPLSLNHEIMQKASKYRSGAKVSSQGSRTSKGWGAEIILQSV